MLPLQSLPPLSLQSTCSHIQLLLHSTAAQRHSGTAAQRHSGIAAQRRTAAKAARRHRHSRRRTAPSVAGVAPQPAHNNITGRVERNRVRVHPRRGEYVYSVSHPVYSPFTSHIKTSSRSRLAPTDPPCAGCTMVPTRTAPFAGGCLLVVVKSSMGSLAARKCQTGFRLRHRLVNR